nr:hypothetical protein [Hephaestia mangrovi]
MDDAVVADYKQAAAEHGRSLEAELRDVLTNARPKRRLSKAELIALSERLRAATPLSSAKIDSTDLIRADRDAR